MPAESEHNSPDRVCAARAIVEHLLPGLILAHSLVLLECVDQVLKGLGLELSLLD